jgi:negative regulator of sigma E activity
MHPSLSEQKVAMMSKLDEVLSSMSHSFEQAVTQETETAILRALERARGMVGDFLGDYGEVLAEIRRKHAAAHGRVRLELGLLDGTRAEIRRRRQTISSLAPDLRLSRGGNP